MLKPLHPLVIIVAAILLPSGVGSAQEWENPIHYLGKLGSPLVEVTPFVFDERYYLLENWQKQWEIPGTPDGDHFQRDEIRIRDMASDRIISTPLVGHGLGMAFVHDGRVYVFAGNWGTEKKWEITEISMVSSDDLVNWTDPIVVLEAEPQEKFFNVSVCKGPDDFVLLVESNDPRWPAFTFKYFTSDDLIHWTIVEGAEYGREKYVGGPALYFEGDWFYTLYLQSLGNRQYETRVARSRNLVRWQDAPPDRPVATFNPENDVHHLRPEGTKEANASDLEFCFWKGKTRIYYTGGDQRFAGDLQHAEYDGTPRELLEHFFKDDPALEPSAKQLRYMDNQLGAFVHFGPASYVGSDMLSVPDADLFNPAQLDADQWMQTAKSFGAQHIVLTAKHHNGYCLWPTKTTDYSIEASPWKNGEGDLVRAFVDAAREHGLSPGLYISAGDTHQGVIATPEPRGIRKIEGDVDAYFPLFMDQLRELLSNYGELEVVWFDGAYNPFDPDVLDADGEPVGDRYAGPITKVVRELQPGAVIMGGAEPDVRWAGSEQGIAPYPLWYEVLPGTGRENWLPDDATGWFIPEANIHTRRHWFWTPDSDDTLRSVDYMMKAYNESIGRGANLLVNLTPDMIGQIPEAEVAMLSDFGAALESAGNQIVAQMSEPNQWDEGFTIPLHLESEHTLDRVSIEEDISQGQRVKGYAIQARIDDQWKTVASGESIGRKRIHAFEPVKTNAIRLRVTDFVPMPRVNSFSAFAAASD